MDNVFIVLVSYGLLIRGAVETTYVYNVSYSEETAWTVIERDINDRIAKNKFGNPYINIYPESRFIRVTLPTLPIHCGCNDTDIIYKYHDYKIINKPITD